MGGVWITKNSHILACFRENHNLYFVKQLWTAVFLFCIAKSGKKIKKASINLKIGQRKRNLRDYGNIIAKLRLNLALFSRGFFLEFCLFLH